MTAPIIDPGSTRAGFDLLSGYKHKDIPPNSNMTLEQLRKEGYLLDDHAWMNVTTRMISHTTQEPTIFFLAYFVLGEHCGSARHGGCHSSSFDQLAAYGTTLLSLEILNRY